MDCTSRQVSYLLNMHNTRQTEAIVCLTICINGSPCYTVSYYNTIVILYDRTLVINMVKLKDNCFKIKNVS